MPDTEAAPTGTTGSATEEPKGPVHARARSRGAEVPPVSSGVKKEQPRDDPELVRRVWAVSVAAQKTLNPQDAFLTGLAAGVSIAFISPNTATKVRRIVVQSGALAAHRTEDSITRVINGLAEDIIG